MKSGRAEGGLGDNRPLSASANPSCQSELEAGAQRYRPEEIQAEVTAHRNRWSRQREAKRSRFVQLWDELLRLERHRGGFQQGCRNNAMFYGTILLKEAGKSETTIRLEIEALAKRCSPIPKEYEVKSAISAGMKDCWLPPPANSTIASALRVSEEEVAELGLQKLRRDFCAGPEKREKEAR